MESEAAWPWLIGMGFFLMIVGLAFEVDYLRRRLEALEKELRQVDEPLCPAADDPLTKPPG